MEYKFTTDNFEAEVLKSELPVLVDFYADWCGPCKMLSPIIEDIADHADGFKVCSVNVDDEPELAGAFQVSSIPTLLVFKNGALANRAVGFMPKAQVLNLLK